MVILKKCCKFRDQLNHNLFLIKKDNGNGNNLDLFNDYYITQIWFGNIEKQL